MKPARYDSGRLGPVVSSSWSDADPGSVYLHLPGREVVVLSLALAEDLAEQLERHASYGRAESEERK
jgi:hypothetical protein